MNLPPNGKTREEVRNEIEQALSRDADWRGGKIWSLVYFAGDDVADVLKDAYNAAFFTNGLGPGAFKSLRKFESEIISMTANLLSVPEGDRQRYFRRHREHPHGREDRPRLRPRRARHHRAGDGAADHPHTPRSTSPRTTSA